MPCFWEQGQRESGEPSWRRWYMGWISKDKQGEVFQEIMKRKAKDCGPGDVHRQGAKFRG
jgi:hypothetical protein